MSRRAIIFDIDGTLLSSASEDDRLYREAVRQVFGEVRFRATLRDYPHVTDTGILRQVLADNSLPKTAKAVADVQGAFFALLGRYIDEHGPFAAIPGAREYLERLQGDPGTDVAIATGGWRGSAMMKLRAAGFDPLCVPLATSDDADERTAIMRIALDSLSRKHDTVIYYGDGEWDRAASLELGWEFRAVGAALNGIHSFDAET